MVEGQLIFRNLGFNINIRFFVIQTYPIKEEFENFRSDQFLS